MAETTLSPEMMLNPYDRYLQKAQESIELQGFLDTVAQESQKMVEAASRPQFIPGSGGKTIGAVIQEQQARLQAQEKTQQIAAATDWENLAVTLGQDISMLAQERRQVNQTLQEKAAVSIFDDPLQALANAFTMPWDQQKLDAIDSRMKSTHDTLQVAHNHVQQSAVTADKISTKITQANLAEIATAGEAYQASIAAEARMKAAQSGADRLAQVAKMNDGMLDLYLKTKQMQQQDEQMKLARDREARQMKLLDLQFKKEADEEKAEQARYRFAKAAMEWEGKKPLDFDTFKQRKGLGDKFIDTLVVKGMELAISGTATHGADMGQRAQWQKTIGWKPETPQQITVINMQNEAWKAAGVAKGGKPDVATAEPIFVQSFRDGQKDIREGSPFMAPSWVTMGKTEIIKHPVWQQYIVPQLNESNGYNPVNPQIIADAVANAVAEKKITSSEAAYFAATVFKSAIALNNESHQFAKITGGHEQTQYGARLSTSKFGGRQRFELTDSASWNAVIAAKIADKFQVNPAFAGPALRERMGGLQ